MGAGTTAVDVPPDHVVPIPCLPSWPPSSRGILSPPLLAGFHDSAHIPHWPNLENAAVLQRWMLRDELLSMIHVPRLQDENAAELLLGFRIRTVGSSDFAVLPREGQGGFRTLKRFSASPMPVGAKMVVVLKAFVEHGVSLALGQRFVFAFVVVSKTDVFHYSSPSCSRRSSYLGGKQQPQPSQI